MSNEKHWKTLAMVVDSIVSLDPLIFGPIKTQIECSEAFLLDLGSTFVYEFKSFSDVSGLQCELNVPFTIDFCRIKSIQEESANFQNNRYWIKERVNNPPPFEADITTEMYTSALFHLSHGVLKEIELVNWYADPIDFDKLIEYIKEKSFVCRIEDETIIKLLTQNIIHKNLN